MEALTQKIFIPTLVAVIKGVAISWLLADVVVYYAKGNAGRVLTTVKKKLNIIGINSQLQTTKN